MTTPNMGLDYPSPSLTIGPLWASMLNACLDLVDTHDHTATHGVKVPTAGLNINADLSMGSFNLTTIRSLRLNDQVATLSQPSDLRIIYAKNGELTYRDGAGNEVIITSAGSVAGATGTITGLSSPASASFNSLTGAFSFLKDTSKPGKIVSSDILIYEFDNATANPITLKSPASVSAAYSITLPGALPAQTGIITMTSAGVLAVGLGNGSESAPSVSFAADPDTGWYRSAANELTATIGGTDFLTMNATGMGLTVGSNAALTVDSAGIVAPVVRTDLGSVSAPSHTFDADTASGMYHDGGVGIAFATAGSVALSLTASAVTAEHTFRFQDGDITNPGLAFVADTDTGIFRNSANQLGVSCGGTSRAVFSSSGLDIIAGLQTNAGGFIKFKTFTGNILQTQALDFTAPGGGTIFGIYGVVKSGSSYAPVTYTASSSLVFFQATTTAESVSMFNPSGSGVTWAYRVVVVYG